ncbi:uncharacterized protein BDR25DRAFT_363611 [Lindgomyces ingoldianus]|uniref:Uncharacterized protein n=1 Tax=Lindgomyces ingoldianus TaxID=673940 RepID=A0ACB6Q8U8_9PLEO|nr:uncharacterized protein BDR25DRAFT_363611 [Lindgomyces ingoldianus]KAF2462777.1 hypothetical protein BDR25DRAFT_363611 [Lindgomyces ingoldianus]
MPTLAWNPSNTHQALTHYSPMLTSTHPPSLSLIIALIHHYCSPQCSPPRLLLSSDADRDEIRIRAPRVNLDILNTKLYDKQHGISKSTRTTYSASPLSGSKGRTVVTLPSFLQISKLSLAIEVPGYFFTGYSGQTGESRRLLIEGGGSTAFYTEELLETTLNSNFRSVIIEMDLQSETVLYAVLFCVAALSAYASYIYFEDPQEAQPGSEAEWMRYIKFEVMEVSALMKVAGYFHLDLP